MSVEGSESILISYDQVPEGRCKVYIRMYDVERSKLTEIEKELKGIAKLLYMVDHSRNIREIYQ